MTHPALDRLAGDLLQIAPDIPERRRTRATAEILVPAADGEVDLPVVEPDRNRTDRVAQVPQHRCASRVNCPGDGRHVSDVPRAVGHVAADKERGSRANSALDLLGRESGSRVGLDPAQRAAELSRYTLQQVAVGREVVGVDDDLGPVSRSCRGGTDDTLRQGEGCPGKLVEQHRGGVGHQRLARSSSQSSRRQLVAHLGRPAHPLVGPALDQAGRPALRDEVLHGRGGRHGWPAE
jgi:hypothetical protein